MRTPDQMTSMLCPIDKVPLTMSDRQGVEIDYCPQCRGVWLDRGELDKIIERSEAVMAPPPQQQAPPPPQQGYSQPWGGGDQRYGHKRHKKSFLQELFD